MDSTHVHSLKRNHHVDEPQLTLDVVVSFMYGNNAFNSYVAGARLGGFTLIEVRSIRSTILHCIML
jgi:hypothetical protein